jgi:glycosyltransferase involved in cell wall biosynthesis
MQRGSGLHVLVSIVTPNLNRDSFLRFTMDSVLAAKSGGNLEYIVVDGGSTDSSLHLLQERQSELSLFLSEPDEGIYDAVNKGFSYASGDVLGWLNSGDYLFPGSISILSDVFQSFPEIEWITSRVLSFLDPRGRLVEQNVHYGVAQQSFLSGEHLNGFSRAPALSLIQQEATFWRRSLWERAGARLDTRFRLAADFELWTRFFDHAELWTISAPIGAFRRHSDQLSRTCWDEYLSEAHQVLAERGRHPRNWFAQTVSVGLRLKLPRRLRPLAHYTGLFAPAPFCEFDAQARDWRLARY